MFSFGFRLTLPPKRTRSIHETSEIIKHIKEMILTAITLQRLKAQISRALPRDS